MRVGRRRAGIELDPEPTDVVHAGQSCCDAWHVCFYGGQCMSPCPNDGHDPGTCCRSTHCCHCAAALRAFVVLIRCRLNMLLRRPMPESDLTLVPRQRATAPCASVCVPMNGRSDPRSCLTLALVVVYKSSCGIFSTYRDIREN